MCSKLPSLLGISHQNGHIKQYYKMLILQFPNCIAFLDGKKSHVLCTNSSVRKIVNDGLSKTLVRALPYGTVWVDKPSPDCSFWSRDLDLHVFENNVICFIQNYLPWFFKLLMRSLPQIKLGQS